MFGQGAQDPQLKFNDSLNQHFPWLIFFEKYFVHKNRRGWRRITKLLKKNVKIDGYVY